MENNFMLTDDLLWDYADGLLKGEEKLLVDTYLRQQPEQKARLDAIMAEKSAFAVLQLEKPDTGFAKRVMVAWAAEQSMAKFVAPAKAKSRDWVLWGIVASFLLLLAVPLLLLPSAAPLDFSIIPEQYIPHFQTPTFDWAGFFGSDLLRNALLFTMALLGLKLLDKYFQVRNLRLSA